MDNFYIINCPHCDEYIIIPKKEINCKIFRHGVYKDTYELINPHMDDIEAILLYNNQKIYGCGKSFTYDGYKIELHN